MRCVVLGATGSVGRAILNLLEERGLAAPNQMTALSSTRTAGQEISVGESGRVRSQDAATFSFQAEDLVFSAVAPDVAMHFLPKALQKGARIIDKSSAFRRQHPLIVPEVNGQRVTADTSFAASPNCVVIPLVVALNPLAEIFGLNRVVVSTYQSVSGAGKQGMEQLYAETKQILMMQVPDSSESPFGRQIALNVLPQIGEVNANGISDEEDKIQEETKLLLGQDVQVTAFSVRVPVLIGHGMSVTADFSEEVDLEKVQTAFEQAPGCLLSRKSVASMDVVGEDSVFVSRLRKSGPKTLTFWVVCDNLRKGAALNAVQIAELMLAR